MKNKDYEIGQEIRTWSVNVPDRAAKEVEKTLKSTWINTGKKEKEFRQKICDRFKAPYAVATTSGTSALKAALVSLGVGYGDEVVSTPYTFIATNTAILELGAIPKFADIQYDTLNIDPKSIEKQITDKTKAIMCVHYAGNTVDLEEIRKIGRKYNLPVIEDSAHAMGAAYRGDPVGSTGDVACFSFQCVKIVTCGDGGVITTTREDVYNTLKKKVWYGIDRDTKKTDILDPLPAPPDGLGFKMNMNDITATLACVAMEELDAALLRRRNIGETYRKEFANLSNLEMMNYKQDRTPNYQIFPVHVQNRRKFAEYMWDNGIQVNVNNRRNDIYDMFGGLRNDLPNLARADKDVILLPLHLDLTDADVARVIDKVKKYA
jgi:dTDP-4-amino-4,6-dideoxygalactose transaminase